jgi:hypothetical protein
VAIDLPVAMLTSACASGAACESKSRCLLSAMSMAIELMAMSKNFDLFPAADYSMAGEMFRFSLELELL